MRQRGSCGGFWGRWGMFEQRPLSTLIERQIGGGTPPRSNPAFWNGPIPWASVKDFEDASLTLSSTAERISQSGLDASTANLIPAGTPLVCTRMAVGRCAITTQPVAINQDVRALTPKTEVQPRYLLRLLDFLRPAAESQAVGSTVKGIRTSDYLTIKVPVAPVIEQPAIARILDTLDTQIEKTQALIAKLEQVKEGLLHDLLTRGVDEHGELRPSAEEAPELYKASALGLIPRGWEVQMLSELSQYVTYGFTNPMPTVDDGPFMVTAADIIDGRIDYENSRRTSESEFRKLSAKSRPGRSDILITKDGTLGRVAVVTQGGLCVNQSVAVVRPKSLETVPLLVRYLSSPIGQKSMLAGAGGSTIKHLYISKLEALGIPWPSIREAEIVSSRIDSMEQCIQLEKHNLRTMTALKSGLMDDLLTGRVRVTPLLERDPSQAT